MADRRVEPDATGAFSALDPTNDVVLASIPHPSSGPAYFVLKRWEAREVSTLLASLLEATPEGSADAAVELHVVDLDIEGNILLHCVAYFAFHAGNPAPDIEKPMTRPLHEYLTEWDSRFLHTQLLKNGDERQNADLIGTLKAAHYLGAKKLQELCGAGLASLMRGKSISEVQQLVGVQQDQSEEELRRIRESNAKYEEAMNL
jgi:hypothetical protein